METWLSFRGKPETSFEEHKSILNAIKEKDADKAEFEVKKHFDRYVKQAKATLKRNEFEGK